MIQPIKTQQIKTILFDLDGTLSNPKEGIIGSIQYALERLSVKSFKNEDLLWCIGPPLQETFAELLNTKDAAPVERAVMYYREHFVEKGMFQNKLYKGIRPLLQELSALDYKLFVATSKPQVFAKQIIKHFKLEPYFSHVYGAELEGTRSNKADLIAYILQSEALNAATSLMIGDRKHDIIGAKKNGLESAAVLWGFGSREELKQSGADYLVASPAAILDLVHSKRT